VKALRQVAGRVISGSRPAIEAAVQLLDLTGELLPSWDEEWLVLEREELKQIQLQAFESCSNRLSRSGYHAAAMALAYEAIRADPLRESAHRQLIAIHLAQGNRVQAMQVYQRFSKILWDDYQVRPSQRLQELVEAGPRAVERAL
jgi:two-component SAPR family response regulator